MDENRVARFRPVLGGGSRRGSPVWGLSRFVGTRSKGQLCLLMMGEMFQSQEAESEAKCDLCLDTGDQMVWTGVGCAER